MLLSVRPIKLALAASLLVPCASFAAAQPGSGADCTDIPPEPPPPPLNGMECHWVKIDVEEGWTEFTSTPSGPSIELLWAQDYDYECHAGLVPCDHPTPPLNRTVSYSEQRTDSYGIGGNISLEAAAGFAIKLITDAKASISFNGTYSHSIVRTFTNSFQVEQPWCSELQVEVTVEKYDAVGTAKEAGFRVTWCSDCICGTPKYTYCPSLRTASGQAQGWKEGQETTGWSDDCFCVKECPH